MPNKSLSDLRTAARQLANYQDSDFVEDPELTDRVNEAISSYYDLVLGSRETYFQTTVAFTLAGGFGGNTFTLPADQYKIQGVDYKPNTTSQVAVPTLPSFRERFTAGYRCYDWVPGTLTIYPPTASAGNYLLYYTPYAPVLVADIDTLPDRLQSGALWIETFVATAILDKAEQSGADAMRARLAEQTARLQSALRWRQDEPKQVPLVRRRGAWGFRGGFGGGWW